MAIQYKTFTRNSILQNIIRTDTENPAIYMAIPINPENTDYQEYLAWVSEGNTAEEVG
tara:strand:- start:41 stop:214 length:174 start_codon:yes stop_codon:yes gene_type:complete